LTPGRANALIRATPRTLSIHAVIWGACGSLPSPATTPALERKIRRALWAARDQTFESEDDVDRFLESLPLSWRGTYKGNTSCVQIDSGSDEIVLCDAGTGIRDCARALGPSPAPRTYHIFISHLHWDHIQGFPFFAPVYQPGNRIVFHGGHRDMEKAIRNQMGPPWFPVDCSAFRAEVEFDLIDERSEIQVGGMQVRAIRQEHPGESWGYRFERGGKSIVYSTDSEHGTETNQDHYPFVEFFRDADILIFDGQYTFAQAANEKRHWGHSSHITGVELAARAQARTLVIFHHEPANDDAELESFLEKARQYREIYSNGAGGKQRGKLYPLDIALARDGLVLEA